MRWYHVLCVISYVDDIIDVYFGIIVVNELTMLIIALMLLYIFHNISDVFMYSMFITSVHVGHRLYVCIRLHHFYIFIYVNNILYGFVYKHDNIFDINNILF